MSSSAEKFTLTSKELKRAKLFDQAKILDYTVEAQIKFAEALIGEKTLFGQIDKNKDDRIRYAEFEARREDNEEESSAGPVIGTIAMGDKSGSVFVSVRAYDIYDGSDISYYPPSDFVKSELTLFIENIFASEKHASSLGFDRQEFNALCRKYPFAMLGKFDDFDLKTIPVHDGDGKIIGYVSDNIVDQAELTAKIRESFEKLEQFIASAEWNGYCIGGGGEVAPCVEFEQRAILKASNKANEPTAESIDRDDSEPPSGIDGDEFADFFYWPLKP